MVSVTPAFISIIRSYFSVTRAFLSVIRHSTPRARKSKKHPCTTDLDRLMPNAACHVASVTLRRKRRKNGSTLVAHVLAQPLQLHSQVEHHLGIVRIAVHVVHLLRVLLVVEQFPLGREVLFLGPLHVHALAVVVNERVTIGAHP